MSLWHLFYPPRCVICRKLLSKQQTDLCHSCRQEVPDVSRLKINIPFVARWTSLWYYKEDVRQSLLRYKFYNHRSYAKSYGRLLAMKLATQMPPFDVLTWIPIAPLRKFNRGYDQVELIARTVAKELDVPAVRTLRKIRNTPPQSGIPTAAQRRANVLGAYRAVNTPTFAGKRVMLLDDIITTGATASECARTLLVAGAEKVFLASVAVTGKDK